MITVCLRRRAQWLWVALCVPLAYVGTRLLFADAGSNNSIPRTANNQYAAENILSMTPPKFLKNYKNPCFYSNDTLYCLPYFHVIGVLKCGTTALFWRLHHHPNVYDGSRGKEVHYWNHQRFGIRKLNIIYDHETISLNGYMKLFAKKKILNADVLQDGTDYHPNVFVDSTADTFCDFDYWKRMPENEGCVHEPRYTHIHQMKHIQPDMKLLLILRNPIDRVFSDYRMRCSFDRYAPKQSEFHEFVIQSINYIKNCTLYFSLRVCIFQEHLFVSLKAKIHYGLYALFLKEWLAVYPREQMFIFRLEDHSADVKGNLKQIFEYLELPPLSKEKMDEMKDSHEPNTKQMWNETKVLLQEFYRESNKELAFILKDDKYLWKDT